MLQTLILLILALLSWDAPTSFTNGTSIPWDAVADMVYQPAISSDGINWQDQATTELLWAEVPSPPAGSTWYYSCRAFYCPNFVCGQPSGYAPPISLTVEPYISPTEPPPPTKKGWGKGGKPK